MFCFTELKKAFIIYDIDKTECNDINDSIQMAFKDSLEIDQNIYLDIVNEIKQYPYLFILHSHRLYSVFYDF